MYLCLSADQVKDVLFSYYCTGVSTGSALTSAHTELPAAVTRAVCSPRENNMLHLVKS